MCLDFCIFSRLIFQQSSQGLQSRRISISIPFCRCRRGRTVCRQMGENTPFLCEWLFHTLTQKGSQPLAMTGCRGRGTCQCPLIISRPKSLILLLSVCPHRETSSQSWLTHRNPMFRKSLSCPYKQFYHNNLAAGTRASFKFCSAWFTIKI